MRYVILIDEDSGFGMVVQELFDTMEEAQAYSDTWISPNRQHRIVAV